MIRAIVPALAGVRPGSRCHTQAYMVRSFGAVRVAFGAVRFDRPAPCPSAWFRGDQDAGDYHPADARPGGVAGKSGSRRLPHGAATLSAAPQRSIPGLIAGFAPHDAGLAK